ncbi:unnamed protein product [Urochloa humidicola]
MPRSPQLSLSGCSSLFSLSSTSTSRDNDSADAAAAAAPPPPSSLRPLPLRGPLLSLSVGGGGGEDEQEDEEEYLLGGLDLQLNGAGGSNSGGGCDGDDERKNIRMMKNRESALRSRARKRAYVQELEKEVRRLVNENLKLKRQCKQLKVEMATLIQSSSSKSNSLIRRTSSSTQL